MLLHGAVEVEADPTAPPPMAAAASPDKGPVQKEKGHAAGSGGLSGGEAARNSSTPEPVEDDGSQDDRDLVHLVTAQSHGSEVCPIFTSYSYSSRGEAGLPDTIYISLVGSQEIRARCTVRTHIDRAAWKGQILLVLFFYMHITIPVSWFSGS